MTGDEIARLAAGVMMIGLVGSSLIGRRLNFGQTLQMVLAWSAIFAAAFVLFLFRDEARGVWARATADVAGSRGTVSGKTLRIQMRDDGHFWISGTVNGRSTEFLVDSGATTTALSETVARAANVDVDTMFPISVETANGSVNASTARIERLVIGPIVQSDARAVVSSSFGDTNLLGMSFLSSLKSWRVEGRTLILEP